MTYAGAAGITANEMSQVLHVGDEEHWHNVFGALQASISRGADLEGYEFSLANRIWPQEGYPFLDTFIGILTDLYDSSIEYLDFMSNPEAARMIINEWVESQTNDRIKDLLPPGIIDEITRIVLTNAIYFKGTWLTQFDPDETYEGSFIRADDSAVTTSFMVHRKISVPVGYSGNTRILSLPFRGEDISMIIVLPSDNDDLQEVEESLSSAEVESWLESLTEWTFDSVILPKFGFTSSFQLHEILTSLGMPSAFTSQADFSGMTGTKELCITDVIHKAFIEVNEEGAEAAAATAVPVGYTGCNSFYAGHPFLFLLYDHVTGIILFMGRVEDPTAS